MIDDMIKRMRHRRDLIKNVVETIPLGASVQGAPIQALASELATIENALIQFENTKATLAETSSRDLARVKQDDADYWFRRWMISLAIANGAAFLGVVSAIEKADQFGAVALLVRWPGLFFGLGTVLAGILPLFVWKARGEDNAATWAAGSDHKTHQEPAMNLWAARTSYASALFFALGVAFTIGELFGASLNGS